MINPLTPLNTPQAIDDNDALFFKRVKQIPLGIAIIRGKGRIVEMANDKFLQIIGKTEQELLGKPLFDSLADEEELMESIIEGVFTNGSPHFFEEVSTFITQHGKSKESYLDYEYTPLFGNDMEMTGVMVTVNDVTEKVQARKKVENAEESTRLATEIGEIATWELNLQTHSMVHSESLAIIFGYSRSATLSHAQILSHINPEDLADKVDPAFIDAMQTSIYRYEARMVKLSGENAWVGSHGKIFFDDNGEPLKMIGTLIDITDERNRRDILMESEQKFRLLADSMPQLIWTANALGKLNYYNHALFSFSGLGKEQLLNGDWLQLLHPDERKKNKRQWMRAIHSGHDFISEHRFLRHDGAYRWQLSRIIAQKDALGNIQMWVGTGTDIQEQKTFTTELEKLVSERTAELVLTNADLVKMNIELQSFAYVSSHDLQEPMRKIQMITSRLLEKEYESLSDYAQEHFKRLQKTANRMQELIKDLLLYSSTSSQDRIYVKTDLKELVDEVKYEFKEMIDERNAIIEIDFLPVMAVIRFQVKQLFQNLISNALKFAAPQRQLHVHIKAEIMKGGDTGIDSLHPDGNYCHITVTDNGIGFDSQYKLRIFEVFQRLHITPDFNGTGIGLAIVKKIVDNHKGVIVASGKVNKGARFDVYLPDL
jgi:PAS domain S-box-containing protein